MTRLLRHNRQERSCLLTIQLHLACLSSHLSSQISLALANCFCSRYRLKPFRYRLGSVTKMMDSFRFADLPKDFRLSVYDFLPIQTKHHAIKCHDDYKEWDYYQEAYKWDYYQEAHNAEWFPEPKITLLFTSFQSLAILRTCQWIASEAGAIIQPKMEAMRRLPVRIIVNSWAAQSFDLCHILQCLSHSACGACGDVRVLLQPNHLRQDHDHSLELCRLAYQETHIAVCDSLLDPAHTQGTGVSLQTCFH
jgi:hypothetical protein